MPRGNRKTARQRTCCGGLVAYAGTHTKRVCAYAGRMLSEKGHPYSLGLRCLGMIGMVCG